MLITNAHKKLIASLDQSKHRRRSGLFKAEGTKCVLDTIEHFDVEMIAATQEWLTDNADKLLTGVKLIEAPQGVLGTLSNLSSRPEVIAVYRIPELNLDLEEMAKQLVIALDTVQDPGNLGTIVRLADWFGVSDIICSRETVDIYNPKAVMATMGAISRVNVHYTDLKETLKALRERGSEIYGTFLGGENLFTTRLSNNGVIVMGNEGNGISEAVGSEVTRRVTIPSYPANRATSESLNVAMATAITLAQFRNHG